MRWLPVMTETLISELPADRILGMLEHATALHLSDRREKPSTKTFQGKIDRYRFLISRRIPSPNNFVPLIKGRIEATSKGCIIFLNYRLYRSAVMFLIFSLIMCVSIGTLFLILEESYKYAIISYGLAMVNYLITLLSFNRELSTSREKLMNILNIDQ